MEAWLFNPAHKREKVGSMELSGIINVPSVSNVTTTHAGDFLREALVDFLAWI